MRWAVLFLATAAAAFQVPVDVTGELLAWKQTAGGYDYANRPSRASDDTPLEGTISSLEPGHHAGFRFGAHAHASDGCLSLAFSGLYISGHDTSVAPFRVEQRPPFQVVTQAQSNRVESRLANKYWNIDAAVIRHLRRGARASLAMLAAGRYVSFSDRLETSAQGRTVAEEPVAIFSKSSYRTHYYGAGPRIGLTSGYCIEWGLYLNAEVSGGALAGERKLSLDLRSLLDGVASLNRVRYPCETVFTPFLDALVGFGYSHTLWGCDFALEVGYSWQQYWSALGDLPPLLELVHAIGDRGCRNIAYSGPYFRLKGSF